MAILLPLLTKHFNFVRESGSTD